MTSFKATIMAILEFFKIFGPLLTNLVSGVNFLIKYVVDYFTLKNRRIRERILNEREIEKKALEDQQRKETANVAAFKSIEDSAWQIRYESLVDKIKNERFDEVLKIIDSYDNDVIDNILFDSTKSPEYRAMKIVKRMMGIEKA